MNDSNRALVAAIAGRLVFGRSPLTVYDYGRDKMILLTGEVSAGKVDLFDHDQRCQVSGTGSNGNFSLYHLGGRNYIQLEIRGSRFTGFDHFTRTYYYGGAYQGKISLYDFGAGARFEYRI